MKYSVKKMKDNKKKNLFACNEIQLKEIFIALNESTYRAIQLLQAIHQHKILDFMLMSNLSKKLRTQLAEKFCIKINTQIASHQKSQDGTQKWLLKLEDGNCIETVLIPEGDRNTLCISSQVGCALRCSFCATGQQGFSRNMTSAEILSQLWLAQQQAKVTNIVFMGMGEPLLNLENVLPVVNLLTSDYAYGLSKYRVTISTAGVIPGIQQLSNTTDVALALSLHASNDKLRNQLVPINQKYSLDKLLSSCKIYCQKHKKRKITIEYVMLAGINDQNIHARQMIKLLSQLPCKINLIPFNKVKNVPYTCSSQQQINNFAKTLQKAGFIVMVRRTRGNEIAAACGQLKGQIEAINKKHIARSHKKRFLQTNC